jgi:hypothetical protein
MARTLLFDARFAAAGVGGNPTAMSALKGTSVPFGENFSRKGFVPCQGTPFNLKTVTWGEVPHRIFELPHGKGL